MGDVTHTDADEADLVRTCTRKKGYPTQDIAKMAVDSIRRSSPMAAVRAYACRHCGQWHVGGTPVSERSEFPREDDAPAREVRPRGRSGAYSRGRRPRRRSREED